ncbi:hypothetical protein CC86DRAFT_91299 [Ophiobolus disseminans]|uniref:Uncharacterized protein n=1 Tax=Ophiobolus disseminans TaxID=1469910 RepID=A0A6A7AGZ6_9PLEO|nr:hypothetical protein CC86DRAFT_91299 [Ophiobolus disseminans]
MALCDDLNPLSVSEFHAKWHSQPRLRSWIVSSGCQSFSKMLCRNDQQQSSTRRNHAVIVTGARRFAPLVTVLFPVITFACWSRRSIMRVMEVR